MNLPTAVPTRWTSGLRRRGSADVDDVEPALEPALEQAAEQAAERRPPLASRAVSWRVPLAGASIRWRLSLAYSLMLLTTLTSFSLGIYWYVGNTRMDELVRDTESRAEQVRDDLDGLLQSTRAIQQLGGRIGVGAMINDMIYRSRFVQKAFDPFVAPGTGLRIFDSRHNLVFPPPEDLEGSGIVMAGLPTRDQVMRTVPNRLAIVMALRGMPHREVVTGIEGDQVLAYTVPFYQTNPDTRRVEVVAALQMLTSLKAYNDTMDALKRILVFGTLLATGLSVLTGAALAQTAIAPIHRIARTAERINRAQDLGRRIEVDCPRDELGQLSVTINEMLDRIASMFERQRRFLADVSHELRTPLTTIRGEVELMERTQHMDEEGLTAIREESERMSRMITDLLLLARADTEVERMVDHAPVHLDALVLDVFQQAQMLGRSHSGHQVRLGHEERADILGDRDRLKQLLLNLVTNAFRHTPEGTTITLSLHREGRQARLVVADDGPGIPPEDLPNIFDRFYRVDTSRTRFAKADGGTGLGLAIVRSIARAHGGEASVECLVGGGTAFTVILPLAADSHAS